MEQNTGTTPTTQPLPTSAKLVELQTAFAAKFAGLAGLTTMAEQQSAMLETFKIQKEIDAEIANIKTQERQAELEKQRNARIELVTNLETTLTAKLKVDAEKKSSDEERNAANDAYLAAREIVTNELLARYATSKPAAKTAGDASDKPAGERGKTGAEIIALHTANLAAGMSPADSKAAIVASGFSRGTTGAVVLAWEREQGLK